MHCRFLALIDLCVNNVRVSCDVECHFHNNNDIDESLHYKEVYLSKYKMKLEKQPNNVITEKEIYNLKYMQVKG